MNQVATQNDIHAFFNSPMAQQPLQQLLGEQTANFTASLVQIVNNSNMLKNVNPHTILGCALTSASLDLPISDKLGYAYIVPYKGQAQFQIGYKGFIQLAQRTGQFKRIEACAIYQGDSEQDVYQRLTSLLPVPPKDNMPIIGYIAYFQLHNGYEARLVKTVQELQAHAQKYSQSYQKGGGVWKTNFQEMALKTVIKLLLSKQAPLSIANQMSQAIEADQAVIINGQYRYIDNEQDSQASYPSLPKMLDDTAFGRMIMAIQTGFDNKGQPFDKARARMFLQEKGYALNPMQEQQFLSA